VYGRRTSNGSAALQLAKAAGVSVFAVAGKKNHELCRELGAVGTVDYKDSDWIANAASQLRGKRVVGAYDSIGTNSTTKAIAQVLPTAGFDVPRGSFQRVSRGVGFWD
jgi:NADPH:quinone reductase-like Zn-dependent oxidoreductase